MGGREKILKVLVIAGGFSLFLLILGFSAIKITSIPRFCSLCHEMRPEYMTWQVSAHSKVTCIRCHIEPGLRNLVDHKIKTLPQLYLHFSKKYYLPITMPKPMDDSICTSCHTSRRDVTPYGDLRIPHALHQNKKVPCVECHSGVVHGRIAERQMTIDGDFLKWNPVMAKPQMGRQYTATKMDQCMECHRQRGVTNACAACHSELVKPQDHSGTKWTREHGKEARKSIPACDRCHSITRGYETIFGVEPVAEYARTNTLCYDCHMKRPSGHVANWKTVHGNRGAEPGCKVCHNSRQPIPGDKATNTYCQQCHNQRHQYFNRETHPIRLLPGTKLSEQCFACHTNSVCTRCHDLGPRAPAVNSPPITNSQQQQNSPPTTNSPATRRR